MRRLLLFCAVLAVAVPFAYAVRWAFEDDERFGAGWRVDS